MRQSFTKQASVVILMLAASLLVSEKSFAYQPVRLAEAPAAARLVTPVAATTEAATPFEAPWAYSCSSAAKKAERLCEAFEIINVRDGQSLVQFRIAVRFGPPDRTPAMMITLPNGFYLPAGIRLTIDGKEWMPAAVQTCDGGGCYVGLPLKAADRTKLEGGNSLEIHFQSIARKETSVTASLKGLGDALAKIE
ncbi:MAG: invasion associated locus B family protein [Parvibaculaceae bacterium]